MRRLVDIPSALFRHLAPARCAACDEHLCSAARSCFCVACGPLVEPASFGSACFEYGGPMAEAVRSLKYRGRWRLGGALGGLMVPRARGLYLGEVDAVIPIPLSRRRFRRRGYNQAELLAAPIADALGVPMYRHLLRRLHAGPPQVGRGRHQRDRSLGGAFVAREGGWPARVLLVDDVRTTGATLEAAEAAIRGETDVLVRRLTLAVTLATEAR